jgi:hypothetical protein
MTTSVDRLLAGLRGVRASGDGWMACCPGHDDRSPSLSIDVTDDGTLLFKCFAGCAQEHVIERVCAMVGIDPRELFPPKNGGYQSNGRGPSARGTGAKPRLPAPWPGLTLKQYAEAKKLDVAQLRAWGVADTRYAGKPAVRLSYRDVTGRESAVRFRVALEKGDGWERFRWQKGATVSLYGLDRLALARERGYVVVVEGDSDTHTLWHHDEPALGVPGANIWCEERDAPALTDIPMIFAVIELDQGGEALRRDLARSAIAPRVRVVDLSPFGVKDPSALHCADPAHFAERWQAAKDASVPLLERPVADVADVADPQGEAGSALLDAVEAFLGRYIAYPSEHARVAHALWVAHTHAMDAWDSTPRLAFLSPEPASGKTRGLEVTELLVPRPVEAINVTAPYLFRKVDDPDGAPTVLFDEIDTVFGPKAREHEDVRGLLNAGHRKGAVAGRCVVRGKTVETAEYPAYCAVALAGLGDLPDTILTRSVIIRMRRRAKREKVEPFRHRLAITEGHALRDRLAAWAADAMSRRRDQWPEMPPGVEDRDADVWEALLAVADAAGEAWPTRARTAAVAMVTQSKESTPSLGVRLLADLRTVFGDLNAMATEAVLTALVELPEAPWAELAGGKPLNARGLASRLSRYEIKSKDVRIKEKALKGYKREDLADAWERYLPLVAVAAGRNAATTANDALPPSLRESATSATSATTPSTGTPNGSEKPRSDADFHQDSFIADQVSLGARMNTQSATATAPPANERPTVAAVADVADSRGDGDRSGDSPRGGIQSAAQDSSGAVLLQRPELACPWDAPESEEWFDLSPHGEADERGDETDDTWIEEVL